MNPLINIARSSALAGLMAAGVALSVPAFAADADGLPQGTIALHGADFASPRAVAHVTRQLRLVATNICTAPANGQIFMSSDQRACYDTAMKDGLAQIATRQQQALRDRAVRLADSRPAANHAD